MFLANAKYLVDQVPDKSLNNDGRKKLDGLRSSVQALVTEFDKHASNTAAAQNWKTRFDQVERGLVSILGAGAATGVVSTTAVANTTDVAGSVTVGTSSNAQAPTISPNGAAAGATPNGGPATASSGTPAGTSNGAAVATTPSTGSGGRGTLTG